MDSWAVLNVAEVTARLLASLKGHSDQGNPFNWKKANDTATFKKARQRIWETTGWSASLQSPGKLQNKPLKKLFQAREMPGDREQPVNTNLPRAHSAWPSWSPTKRPGLALQQRGHSRWHSPSPQRSFQQHVPPQPCSWTEDMNYNVGEKLLDHQAQNNQWFKSGGIHVAFLSSQN